MNPENPTPKPPAAASSFLPGDAKKEAAPKAEPVAPVESAEPKKEDAPSSYDFRNPMLLAVAPLRKLRLHQEEFVQSAAARLSIHLRLEFSLALTGIETIAYQKLARTWGYPSHLNLFKMEPLRGVSVLEISSELGLCMVDRQMGGPGVAPTGSQEISEIEKALLEQSVQLFLEEWCGHWAGVKELKPSILGYENTGSFIQTIPPETVMLVISMEANFGECKGQIQLGIPYLAMEPLIERQCGASEKAPVPAAPAPVRPAPNLKWNSCFDDVCVPVTAEVEGLEMSARQILALKIGDVLPLDAKRLQRINVRVADTLKFHGRPGTLDGQWAVELTQNVNP